MDVLRLEDLDVGHFFQKRKQVLILGIYISVPEGIIVSMVGYNGIGKSTFLCTLLGLHPPLSGKIFLKEYDFSELSQVDRSRYVSAVLSEKFPFLFAYSG